MDWDKYEDRVRLVRGDQVQDGDYVITAYRDPDRAKVYGGFKIIATKTAEGLGWRRPEEKLPENNNELRFNATYWFDIRRLKIVVNEFGPVTP